jgi:hypothetical protein
LARIGKDEPNLKNRKRPYESLYNRWLLDLADRDLLTDISYEDFVKITEDNHCHYCGKEVFWSAYYINKNGNAVNLDRKNNGDYLKADVVVCCPRCNMVKGLWFTYDEFLKLVVVIKEIDNGRPSSAEHLS